ncbi:hypothetical protein AMTR_s00128p00100390 [Amborella trichopoda]|uniref:Uncharacterized protein n=1 Tax=Amborella trichopoda TaxID=13333 RepID=W1NPG0_AMBTC|nr:hypothetical protein AMTR_s00128p00100390 [Amborella trichopoda]
MEQEWRLREQVEGNEEEWEDGPSRLRMEENSGGGGCSQLVAAKRLQRKGAAADRCSVGDDWGRERRLQLVESAANGVAV